MCSPVQYVILGGGIAGVSCAKTLRMLLTDKTAQILLLSTSSIVKSVSNLSQITQNLVEFDVQETPIKEFSASLPGIKVEHCKVTQIKPGEHLIVTETGHEIKYTKVCVCTGARPSLIDEHCPHVIGIRDTENVKDLESRLKNAKKVVVVGNGGIAMELVYGLRNVDVVWAIKDKSVGTSFLDCGAAEFLISAFKKNEESQDHALKPDPRRSKYTVFNLSDNTSSQAEVSGGSALGPDWHENATLKGSGTTNVTIEYECGVSGILSHSQIKEYQDLNKEELKWPAYITLTNGKTIGCDFIISATGVTPNSELLSSLPGCECGTDGGVRVDSNMRVVGLEDIYAAGDICCCAWEHSPHWLQMRLWTQARQMGIFAAQCMASHVESKEDMSLDFCFEVFAHVTRFFGHKVVLLGKFNGQGLDPTKTELIVRVTPGKEYVKVVLKDGRMFGAVLVGETDLEETFENLILNGMDLSHYGHDLLHPNVELEDYFD